MSLPLYLQISERLTRQIKAGLLPDGARLPPEVDLARDLGISVGTLRKALGELTALGLLVRRQGSGNYVRRMAGPVGIYGFFHLERIAGGGLPAARNLAVDRRTAPRDARLPGAEAWRIRRLRLINAAPVALEEIWIDARHAVALDAATLPETLYRFYAAAFGLWIARVEDRIGLGEIPAWAPPDLSLRPGAPCGAVVRCAESRERRVEEVSTTWFDPATARYVARWREDRE